MHNTRERTTVWGSWVSRDTAIQSLVDMGFSQREAAEHVAAMIMGERQAGISPLDNPKT